MVTAKSVFVAYRRVGGERVRVDEWELGVTVCADGGACVLWRTRYLWHGEATVDELRRVARAKAAEWEDTRPRAAPAQIR